MIFNTPNGKSLPGLPQDGLDRGRSTGGRGDAHQWPLSRGGGDRPAPGRSVAAPDGARRATRPTCSPIATAVQALLDSQPDPAAIATRRTPELLAWRYGYEPLGYRVLLRGAHAGVGAGGVPPPAAGQGGRGRPVRRDRPGGRSARHPPRSSTGAAAAAADYLIRVDPRPLALGPFVRLPRVGPVLACRPLDDSPAPALAAWGLSMGDVELF